MVDQQPGESLPAAGVPDPTRVEDGSEPSTVDAPARWSGVAPVPAPTVRGPWWRRGRPADDPAADERVSTPAVDPWAEQATPWDAFTPITEPAAVVPPAPAGPPPRTRPLPPARRPPATPLPAPRPPVARRRRRWGRRLALGTLLGVVCCCGLPFAWLRYPAARQYPVTAVLPESFADLRLLESDPAGAGSFAGVYGDTRGKRVTVYGMTGLRLDPGGDVQAQIDRVTDEYAVAGVQSFDAGERGVHERCGVGRDDGTAVVVCAWADHGSVATVVLTRRSVADSAELVSRLRAEVLTSA